ncbi:MAG: hypothetical protein Q8L85_08770, partial [Alphaproteobacteria bacterium]|nr:hypothetical protein [Alphaproteobacteria bacterium]
QTRKRVLQTPMLRRPPGRTSFLYTCLRIWSFLLSPTLLGGGKLAMTSGESNFYCFIGSIIFKKY